ncbi:MAG: squalene synthase HpnC [Betaproteobacteria bacterium]|nr:squalene synthase HpnC [Betaproteobacteria bacterium]
MPVDHYENFPVASFLLPSHLRRPIEVIYAFARSADDIADEGNLSAAQRLSQLEAYSQQLQSLEAGHETTSPLFQNLAQVIHQYKLPISLFHDLLDAFKQDVSKTRYLNFQELMDYCRRSANPIGRLLLHLYQKAEPQNLQWSDSICSALQLINHWQDVAIDWEKNDNGRVYLPQDELAQYNLSDKDIAAATQNADWIALMQFQCARAREMLLSGAPLVHQLPGRLGWELRFIVAGGACILNKIDAVKGDIFRHRPTVTPWNWATIGLSALFMQR